MAGGTTLDVTSTAQRQAKAHARGMRHGRPTLDSKRSMTPSAWRGSGSQAGELAKALESHPRLAAHEIQIEKLKLLRKDLRKLADHVAGADLQSDHPWNRLYQWADATLGEDAQECLARIAPLSPARGQKWPHVTF